MSASPVPHHMDPTATLSDLARIRGALSYVLPDDRDVWLRMGMAVKSEVGEAGFDLWNDWSQGADSYSPTDARDVWRSIKAIGKVTIGTLYYEARAHGWCDDGVYHASAPEEIAERKQIASERATQEKAEIARDRCDAAKKAAAILAAATPVSNYNPYLARKIAAGTATLYEIEAEEVTKLLGYGPKLGGELLEGRLLVVPIYINDELTSLELIDGKGRKHAIKGGAKKNGCWASEKLPEGDGEGLRLVIGEGVATVLSAREANDCTAIATMSSGNLPAVARIMRKRYPKAELTILADLVKTTGEADSHAVEAARAVGGNLAVPDFGPHRPDGATDFNDLAGIEGLETVRKQLRQAQRVTNEDTDATPGPPEPDAGEVGGFTRPPKPPNLLILPSDHFSYTDAARDIFGAFAPTHKLFVRGTAVVELIETDTGTELSALRPPAFQSRIDRLGSRVMAHVQLKRELALKPKRCSRQVAEVLPEITVVANAPVLIERAGRPHVLEKGYHADTGGILVVSGQTPPKVALAEALEALGDLLRDFDFQTPSDRSRALAMLITPALKLGGFFTDPTPADVAEADQSQAGKTYRQTITRAVYRERGYAVTRREGGVGSLDESLSAGLISGRAFIAMDNLRGRLDSQYLEAAITLPESVPARVPHRGEVLIDARRVTFSLTSNGVETTRDFANRSCIVRIRKRPRGFQWHPWPEGSLRAHVETNQAYYLACVHAVVREWVQRRKPRSDETRHDMRQWAGVLDWIIQHLFRAAPLLDGHTDAQERVSNSALNWLRSICIAAKQARLLDSSLSASKLWELGEEEGVALPSTHRSMDEVAGRKYVGQLMAKIFREAEDDQVEVDGYSVVKSEGQEWDEINRKNRTVKRYTISKVAPSAPSAPSGYNSQEKAAFSKKLHVQGAQGAGRSSAAVEEGAL
jgi:phage/plasmid primase-like uncharacterized protein